VVLPPAQRDRADMPGPSMSGPKRSVVPGPPAGVPVRNWGNCSILEGSPGRICISTWQAFMSFRILNSSEIGDMRRSSRNIFDIRAIVSIIRENFVIIGKRPMNCSNPRPSHFRAGASHRAVSFFSSPEQG